MKHRAAVRTLIDFFETVSPSNVSQVQKIYAPDAYFKDPFNEVNGLLAIEYLFAHMFEQVKDPRFVIITETLQGDHLHLTWYFYFHMPRYAAKQHCIHGATHFRFDQDSRIVYHRDYWDAAEELYEKLPLLGSAMRFLKKIARK